MLIVLSLLGVFNLGLGAPVQHPSFNISDPTGNGEIRFVTNYRSTPEIIWTCLVTTFLCTWVSMHPDIVGYNFKQKRRFYQRVLMFLMAFIVPEIMLLFSAAQWKVAHDIVRKFGKRRSLWSRIERSYLGRSFRTLVAKISRGRHGGNIGVENEGEKDGNPKWKMAHAHFLLMGGVIFSVNGRLEYLELWKLLHDDQASDNEESGNEASNDGENADATDNNEARASERLKYAMARKKLENLPSRNIEINDRSKGDLLTKGLTSIQTLWFIAQFAARSVQKLNVTALEVLTLAYAITTIFAYFFWKDKPLLVQNPIIIHLSIPPVGSETGSPTDQFGDQGVSSEAPSQPGELEELGQTSSLYFISLSTSWIMTVPSAARIRYKEAWLMGWLAGVLDEPDRDTDTAPGREERRSRRANRESGTGASASVSDSSPTPEFPIPTDVMIFGFLAVALLGVPGSIYYIAWNFTFPKLPVGRILWRAACVASTSLPILFAGSLALGVGLGLALGVAFLLVALAVLAVFAFFYLLWFLMKGCWKGLQGIGSKNNSQESNEKSNDESEELVDQPEKTKDQPKESKDQLETKESQSEESKPGESKGQSGKDQAGGSKGRLEEPNNQLEEQSGDSKPSTLFMIFMVPLLVLLFVIGLAFWACYLCSRLILVSLALWSLHDLPPDAHQTVTWSRFFPHI